MTVALTKRLFELDAQFRKLTGREGFGYIASPRTGKDRWVFGDGTVKVTASQAVDYMAHLVLLAERDPALLPYPFDQQLGPEQDRRADDKWVNERLEQYLAICKFLRA